MKGFLTGGFLSATEAQIVLLARALGASPDLPSPSSADPQFDIVDRASADFALRQAAIFYSFGRIRLEDLIEVRRRALPFLQASSVQRTIDDVRRFVERERL